MITTRLLAACVLATVLAAGHDSHAQAPSPNQPPKSYGLKPFKSLCVPTISTGLNWENGSWVSARFEPNRKFIVQKLDMTNIESKPFDEQPLLCEITPPHTGQPVVAVRGCYLTTEVGKKPLILTAETCHELWEYGQLRDVNCRTLRFRPNGLFVQLPTIIDVSSKPKDDYKDSMALTAGQCSQVID